MPKFLDHLWRTLVAGLLMTAISFASWRLFFSRAQMPAPAVSHGELLAWVALSQFLMIVALAYPTVKSRWSGTQLVAALFVACFGIKTFVPFSRMALTSPGSFPAQRVALFVAHGFLVGLFYAVVLVVVFGRIPQPGVLRESTRLHLPVSEWAWKLAVCTAAMVGVFALRALLLTPAAVRNYFESSALPSFGVLLAIEAARSLLLVAFVLPVVKMLRGDRLDAAVAVAVLFAVLGVVSGLIIPSRAMPEDVRIMLLLLNGVTDFGYGFLVGLLFSRRPARI
jgi:hypothetical protein